MLNTKPYALWLGHAMSALNDDDAEQLELAIMQDERTRDGELVLDVKKMETQVVHAGLFGNQVLYKFYGGDAFEDDTAITHVGARKMKLGKRGLRLFDGELPLPKHEIGDRLLHLAAKNHKPKCLRRLLQLGADQKNFNRVGRRPKDCAERNSECWNMFADEARRQREEKRKAKEAEMAAQGLSHVPTKLLSDEMAEAEEHAFESVELGEFVQTDYSDYPDRKAAENIFYYLRKVEDDLPKHKCHLAIGIGSWDMRVAEECAKLYTDDKVDKILFTGSAIQELSDGSEISAADKFSIHALNHGVPEADIIVDDTPNTMVEMMDGALNLLRKHDDFVFPRYDIMLVATGFQQRRAWLTALKHMPDWVWLHNAPLTSEWVDHGVLTDNTWHVDEEHYKVHYGQDLRQKCLEELKMLFEYTEKGDCVQVFCAC
jgi:hypothetical protein